MPEGKVKDLIKRRASIKAKITQFSTYLDVLRGCDYLNDVQFSELQVRLEKFETLYGDFDTFQSEIEMLSDAPEDHYKDRESIESQYYKLVASARTLLDQRKNNDGRSERFQRIEYLKQHFWQRFSNEYVVWLQQKIKWPTQKGDLKEGMMVVIKEKGLPPLMWLLGRIIRLCPGRDGITRVADILTKKGVIRRAYNNICPLPVNI
uniref:DUF5641 domain-containing protein n=1 Tax=Bombyx mori TaxID=7091 RepID=A0A8R2MC51_BOMMO|nr:uncharacterized protein LOC119631227 isoform X2 [Bombyx mori]